MFLPQSIEIPLKFVDSISFPILSNDSRCEVVLIIPMVLFFENATVYCDWNPPVSSDFGFLDELDGISYKFKNNQDVVRSNTILHYTSKYTPTPILEADKNNIGYRLIAQFHTPIALKVFKRYLLVDKMKNE